MFPMLPCVSRLAHKNTSLLYGKGVVTNTPLPMRTKRPVSSSFRLPTYISSPNPLSRSNMLFASLYHISFHPRPPRPSVYSFLAFPFVVVQFVILSIRGRTLFIPSSSNSHQVWS